MLYSVVLVSMVKVKMKLAQLCPTLCDPMDCRIHGILQAGILEWVAFPFSRGSSQPRDKARSPAMQADSFPAEPQGSTMTYIKGQKDVTPKDETPRAEVVQYAPGKSRGELLTAPERMKGLGQGGNDTQLWTCLVVKVKSDVAKNSLHRNLEC